MRQFVIDYLAQECSSAAKVAGYRRETEEADLLITLADGKRVGVCVINRAIRLPEIKERYERNSAKGIYTLYIIDGRMLPQDNTAVEPPHWMAALHTLMYNRIYAYWTEGREVTIRPLHMEWKWGGSPRTVEYGDEIDVNAISGTSVEPATKYIDGAYLSASFGEGAFWTKRQPGDQQYHYSWRNWSYSERKQTPHQEEEQSWDAWEEFNSTYGKVGEEEWEWTGEEFRQRQPRRQQVAFNKHYATLGVPVNASLDEVKQAYRRKAREFHPDLHPNEKEKYTAKMADINAAFDAIVRKAKGA
ncbi:MAG TPA: J domain-containing protein [Phototrophicaceae bacterium]|nr:J domain-containing protein [Phototrophicaceae bacterium]